MTASVEGLPSRYVLEVERTAANAKILEILYGLFAVYGIGWVYSGNLTVGVVALVISSLLFFPIELGLIFGTGGICACLIFPANIAIAFLSANNLRAWAISNRKVQGSVLNVVIATLLVVMAYIVMGFLVLTFALTFISAMFGGQS